MSTDPSGYLRYLPAIYRDAAAPFVGDYLKIFEKLLTGIDDQELDGRRGIQELLASAVIGNLFYPRLSFLFPPKDTSFIPPISGAEHSQEVQILDDLNRYIGVPSPPNPAARFSGGQHATQPPEAAIQAWLDGFLNWLAGWVDLVPDGSWDIDKKRNVIAQSLALYRMRGTPQGIGMLIDLLFLPLTLTGVALGESDTDDSDRSKTHPIAGDVKVTVSNPTPVGITVRDDSKSPDAFVLQDSDTNPGPVVSGYAPWVFDVLITLPNDDNPDFLLTATNVTQVQQLIRQITQLLDRVRPAATRYTIGIVPTMQLPVVPPRPKQAASSATLGVNTLLGIGGGNP